MEFGTEWRKVREFLNGNRHTLGASASALYPELPRVEDTPLLTRPEWIPGTPLPLESIRLRWNPRPAPPAVTGPDEGLPPGHRTYAEAIEALAPPAVFEDRPTYRLLDADLTGAAPSLAFGPATYFDALNVGEAAAHELAAGVAMGRPAGTEPPLRRRVGDPRDLSRRTAALAITTLTVTRSGSYLLHWRDPAKVAHAGGLHQVVPVGVFQPVRGGRGGPGGDTADLDLWRCMVREFGEELLGMAEDYEPGFDQEAWPLHRALSAARADGRLTVRCLGLGVDPLTFAVDVLTVAVFDDTAFGELFGGLVPVNAEGRITRAPFDGTAPSPVQPAGAAALRLAWRHRAALGIAVRSGRAP
ncbi:hypothetical protein GCM10023085_13700 [Actinomadura viridis]|uniref:Uncharacterized protein n=1 Tax=Actinomadura viridis TaxID=58110 RepID=A0A931DVZ7_9ACTN|nr:hypothetical protein [Actinomadura viridis]MBG6093743.1 hypothetical protein [Actinomadura viridis]